MVNWDLDFWDLSVFNEHDLKSKYTITIEKPLLVHILICNTLSFPPAQVRGDSQTLSKAFVKESYWYRKQHKNTTFLYKNTIYVASIKKKTINTNNNTIEKWKYKTGNQ